ncbi:MAG: M20/M25/M40 family metallo-hydrolase [Elusimicrobiales bacterium]|nr:M20/M25/M40 family metallo-hydrolase [Elusimicrobiales bacterium]
MRNLNLFLVPAVLACCAGLASAGYTPDFDRGVDVSLAIQAAIESAASAGGLVPEVPGPAPERPVWVSMEKSDVGALDGALFKSAPIAQNKRLAIYEFKPAELGRLADGMFGAFRRAPGYFAHDTLEAALQDLEAAPAVPARAYVIDQGPRLKGMLELVKEQPIVSAITSLSSYKNRYYRSATGVDSSKWLQQAWGKFAEGRPDISVAAFKHAAFPQESVILTMRGTAEPEKVIVIGGHLDSISGGGDNPAPGADDNASGVAVTNEVIRTLVESGYRPSKTIKFIAFAAEEVGLRGSGEVAAAFKKDGVAVQGMLNLDMVNYKGSALDIYFVSDNTSADQNAFLGKLVDTYTDYKWATFKCGYGCSDHASWTKNGYPASLPFESTFEQYNPNIHKPVDTLAQTGGGAAHALKFARLAVAYAVELAK